MHLKPDKETFLLLSQQSTRLPVVSEFSAKDLDPALLYHRLFQDSLDSFLFESVGGNCPPARYSIMGHANKCSMMVINHKTVFSDNGHTRLITGSPLLCLEQMNFDNKVSEVDYLPHFWGGWVGYLGYELGTVFENFIHNNRNDLNLPELYFLQVDRVIVYDHKAEILKYITAPNITEEASVHYELCVNEVVNTWKRLKNIIPNIQKSRSRQEVSTEQKSRRKFELKANTTKEEYLSMVEKAKAYIKEGDIYQANLAQRFETKYLGDPFELYLKLRAVNPSPFSGFLKFKGLALVSSSPERLIKMEGSQLETRPIAGTRPRGSTPREDNTLSAELLVNEKEKAEHLMLVDLERNDLGRICKFGSVQVTDLMFLEKYSHVSHIVSNIVGQRAQGISLSEILKAVFPGGTITGCPKIRCMEIIDELEPSARGPYSGSFGYIGFSEHMDFNIIIRTILVKDCKAYFHVGAGIVADSVPEKEYQETLFKAAAMVQALSL